jgi:D-sedoheptulose 7-phosphate isomerase
MKDIINNAFNESIQIKQKTLSELSDKIEDTGLLIAKVFDNNGKVLLCGNGGSAADSQHIAAELVIRYRSSVERRALPAIALSVDTSILTAGSNDFGFDSVFARQVEALGNKEDLLIGISTSGNSPNVINAVLEANNRGMETICLLGNDGGLLKSISKHSIVVPSETTARIQEVHILIGHIWCEIIEKKLFL